jgi:lipopolysaccharide heptosyltransferase II
LKILILKPSSLGDVIQALPVLRLIRKQLPKAEVYWWIEKSLAPLLEGDPDLAGVVLFDRKGWAKPRNWGTLLDTIQWMRRQNFDWVIDLQSLLRSGAFGWLAKGNLLVGLDERREGARMFFDLAARRASWGTHAVDWYLSVLPLLGVPFSRDFEWIPKREAVIRRLDEQWGLHRDRWILLQPGARWEDKRWPTQHFAALGKQLIRDYPGHRMAILGGAADAHLGQEIAVACGERCLDLAGKLNLQEMIEWIRAGDLMVTNDTGPMHVAAALGVPVVGLFGPTEPRRTGPYGQLPNTARLELPCVPCMKSRCRNPRYMECLQELRPERVHAKVRELLPAP